MTFAPSTVLPEASFTTPRTIPVDWAAAGSAIAIATSAAHAKGHRCRPFNGRTMGILLKNESNSNVATSLQREGEKLKPACGLKGVVIRPKKTRRCGRDRARRERAAAMR